MKQSLLKNESTQLSLDTVFSLEYENNEVRTFSIQDELIDGSASSNKILNVSNGSVTEPCIAPIIKKNYRSVIRIKKVQEEIRPCVRGGKQRLTVL